MRRTPRALPALLVVGLTWSDDESKLAFTAGNQLWVHELATDDTYQVAQVGESGDSFLAEPRFLGDDAIVSCFRDVRRSIDRHRPGLPGGPGRVETGPCPAPRPRRP